MFDTSKTATYLSQDNVREGVCLCLEVFAQVLVPCNKVLYMAINDVLDVRRLRHDIP